MAENHQPGPIEPENGLGGGSNPPVGKPVIGGDRASGHRGLTGFVRDIVHRLRTPLPGAQPRVRFEMPPLREADGAQAPEAVEPEGEFGEPGPRVSARNPVYMGFMGTVGVGIALALYYVASHTTQLLLWILAALFIALGLDPVVRWLESHRVPRALGIAATILALLAVLGAFFGTLIPTMVDQITQLVNNVPIWIQDFLHSDFYRSIDEQFGIKTRVTEELQKFGQDSTAISNIFGGVLGVGSTIANSLFGVLIVVVLSLYFLSAMPAMKVWAYRLAPRSRRRRVEALSEEITRSVGNYVIGQVCVAVLNATFAFIVMGILKVPFAALLAFVVGFLAFIPLVGGVVAGVIISLVALTAGWQTGVIMAIAYFAYLQFEAYFVSPRIMQRAVAVPGPVAVISVIAGGSLLGVLGALIAIPTAASAMLLIKEVFITRQDKH
ncbi:AI-2E family transporter [Sinomonas cyclohexanicum]|uniref:AI-2E family transporter n=1 Tax=Sinomonas cyclohexanicum TaxID=322009 RepID=A0ABM7PWJ6_SINCY|nr:AI-2E family transporter [Corynebacterium cyclohexanicum]BCT76665.1 AI-2E family transporter [Corynebacterium cyclohexanicum]